MVEIWTWMVVTFVTALWSLDNFKDLKQALRQVTELKKRLVVVEDEIVKYQELVRKLRMEVLEVTGAKDLIEDSVFHQQKLRLQEESFNQARLSKEQFRWMELKQMYDHLCGRLKDAQAETKILAAKAKDKGADFLAWKKESLARFLEAEKAKDDLENEKRAKLKWMGKCFRLEKYKRSKLLRRTGVQLFLEVVEEKVRLVLDTSECAPSTAEASTQVSETRRSDAQVQACEVQPKRSDSAVQTAGDRETLSRSFSI